jgi:hypothetical protein
VTDAVDVSGVLKRSTTWSGVVHVTGNVTVQNEAVLTIKPGTKIIVSKGARIEFGQEDHQPTLVALGTAKDPIRFCGETDRKGYWGGLVRRSKVRPESLLRNVLIEDAGGTGAALTIEGSATLRGVQLVGSSGQGLVVLELGEESTEIHVRDTLFAPVRLTGVKALTELPPLRLAGNGVHAIELDFPLLDRDVSFTNLGAPFRQVAGDLAAVGDDVEVTFGPGVRYEVSGNGEARRASLDLSAARVVAVGTNSSPVTFFGCAGDVNNWFDNCSREAPGLSFGPKVRLENVRVADAAVTTTLGLHYADSVITLKQVSFDGPLNLAGSEGRFSEDSTAVVVGKEPQCDGEVCAHNGPGLWFPSRTWYESWPKQSVVRGPVSVSLVEISDTFRFRPEWSKQELGGLTVKSGGKVTVPEGITLFFGSNGQLSVEEGATLEAVGTAEKPVVLTSNAACDGWSCSSSNWVGIVNRSPNLKLEHVVLENGGRSQQGADSAILTLFAPASLKSVTVRNSERYGILRPATDMTDYLTGNFFSDNAYGDVGDLVVEP